MKKLLSLVLAMMCILGLFGCAKEEEKKYELPEGQFCYTRDKQPVEIEKLEKEYIIDLLNNAEWINDTSICLTDFVFYTKEQTLHYHSDCGTFNDRINKRSTTVSEEQRVVINIILGIE